MISSQSNKWKSMLAIVNQHAAQIPSNLIQQFRRLSIQRFIQENVLAFLLQYIGLMLSTLSSLSATLWLATGTATAFIFMRKYTILPGIWLGSIVAYCSVKASFGLAILCATLFAAQAFFLLWVSYAYISPTLIFYRKWIFAKFLIFTFIFTGFISGLLVIFCYSSLSTTMPALQLWMQWWLANWSSVLISSSAIIAWEAYFPDVRMLKRNFLGLMVWYGLTMLLFVAVLANHHLISMFGLACCMLPILFIISIRYGWCGIITLVFLLQLLLSLAEAFSQPLFAISFSGSKLIMLQLILCTQTILGLFVAIQHQESKGKELC